MAAKDTVRAEVLLRELRVVRQALNEVLAENRELKRQLADARVELQVVKVGLSE